MKYRELRSLAELYLKLAGSFAYLSMHLDQAQRGGHLKHLAVGLLCTII